MLKKTALILIIASLFACKERTTHTTFSLIAQSDQETYKKVDHQLRDIKKAIIAPDIDGSKNDPIWNNTQWYAIDQKWSGAAYSFSDFFARYKMSWTSEALYLLVEIKDDTLINKHTYTPEGNDYIQLFIDQDNSGGKFPEQHNIFNYTITPDGNVIGFDPKGALLFYNHHVQSQKNSFNDVTTWEFKITIYDQSYKENGVNDQVILQKDQKLGFMIAYNDVDTSSDTSKIGSVFIYEEEYQSLKNNANIFGTLVLKE